LGFAAPHVRWTFDINGIERDASGLIYVANGTLYAPTRVRSAGVRDRQAVKRVQP
jgi:hypothetical protein